MDFYDIVVSVVLSMIFLNGQLAWRKFAWKKQKHVQALVQTTQPPEGSRKIAGIYQNTVTSAICDKCHSSSMNYTKYSDDTLMCFMCVAGEKHGR